MGRVFVGIDKLIASDLDEIGFSIKIKTRPSVIAFLVSQYKDQRK